MREKLFAKPAMKILKQELFQWVCERHATNNVLDKHLLREKALELTKTIGLPDFKCSYRWITSFLKEYGIVGTDLAGPARLDPVFSDYRYWIDTMRPTITRYKHRDLFHVDELGMYSDVLPSRVSSSSKIEGDPEGVGTSRNRITVLVGCNSSGTTKLPLLVCGPYSSRTTTKDHVYCHSEDSSISDDLFRDWLTALNDRMSRANRKILLFLKRSRGRALQDFPLSNVNLVYLPKDFPPVLRPLRRDVFHYVKMIFRRRYAERLKRHTSEWNLRDILESLIEAWEKLPREIVVCGFQKTHFRTDDNLLQIDCDCWSNLDTGISFKRFVTFDDDLSDEPPSSTENRRYHGYNLRTSSKEVVQISEASGDSMLDDVVQIEETKSKESLNESARDGPLESNESRMPATQKTRRVAAIGRRGRRGRSSGNQEPKESQDQKESVNRTLGETFPAFPRRAENGERHGNIKNTFAAMDSNAGVVESIDNMAFKRDAPVESNNVAGPVQAIIDKTLTRTTVAKADYTRKLIAGIYESNREARNSANNDPAAEEATVNERAMVSSNEPAENYESNQSCHTASCTEVSEEASLLKEAAPRRTTRVDAEKNLRKRRKSFGTNDSADESDSNASNKKIRKIDCDWFKEFETTFVFGSQNTANCSSSQECNDNIAVSSIVNVTPAASPRN